MDDEKIRIARLRSVLRSGVTQVFAASVCTGVLFLFVALSYSRITLPRYATSYNQKDTQQVVNLLITVVATVIGILLTHCRRLTNEVETKSELRSDELTIPRLHVHFEAAAGTTVAMGIPVSRNKAVWPLVGIYLLTMIIFGFLHSVLSVIFVVESRIADTGEVVPIHIPLSIDIPETYNGKVVDPCTIQISSPGCAYDLAMTSLSSHLVTYAPYTVGGVTFLPPNGTLGLPYYAMQHFADEIAASSFEQERRRYCLPVLDPHLVSCKELPFNQTMGHTTSENLVQYEPLKIGQVNNKTGDFDVRPITFGGTYEIKVPFPTDDVANYKYRTNDQGQGTMLLKMLRPPEDTYYSIITASDNNLHSGGYASLLHRMMHDGQDPDVSEIPPGPDQTYYFVAKCELTQIKYQDNLGSSWRQVDFTLHNGVLRANVTEERCPNPRGNSTSGFADLDFFLEGSGAILSSTDGYSKLLNENAIQGFNEHGEDTKGTFYFNEMSRLDAAVNKIYHLIQTAWSQQTYEYAMKNQTIYDKPVLMTRYPHLYIIRISWTPTTYIGLALSILITLNAYILVGRWIRAVRRLGLGGETWNLLRPVDLMAYSIAAYQNLFYSLDTVQHRKMAMDGHINTILHERPTWYNEKHSPVSTVATNSPISPLGNQFGSPVHGRATHVPTVTTHAAEAVPPMDAAEVAQPTNTNAEDTMTPAPVAAGAERDVVRGERPGEVS